MQIDKQRSKAPLFILIGMLLIGAFFFYDRTLHGDSTDGNSILERILNEKTEENEFTFDESEAIESNELEADSHFSIENSSIDISSLNNEEQKKWNIFQEILQTKNDNDLRLDKDLRNTSETFHQILRDQYNAFPMENRSERGLITFLIARDLKSLADLEFLKTVYQENPCLSLDDCSSRGSSDPHLSGIEETSTNYPQMAALYQLEKQLSENPELFKDSNKKDHFRAIIEQALRFPAPAVQKKAAELQAKIPF